MLTVAGSIDIDADGVHGQAIEDGGRERGVAKKASPIAESDVRRDSRGSAAVTAIDEIIECVRGRGLVVTLFDLTKTDIIDDEQSRTGPGLESTRVRAIGKAGVKIIEEIDTTCIAHAYALLTSAKRERFEQMALAGATLAGDDKLVLAPDEVEASELGDERFVEFGLEVPLECLERFGLNQAARENAALDALFEFAGGLEAEHVLEKCRRTWALAGGPGEPFVELGEGERQPEKFEVPSESFDDKRLVLNGTLVATVFCSDVV